MKFLDSDEPSSSRKFVLKTLPKAVVKREHDTPLPNPFVLPKNFRPDVRAALECGKMTLETTKSFLSTVAAAMATFTFYPSKDDYTDVARTIIEKYPFMKSRIGKPYVSIYTVPTAIYITQCYIAGSNCRRLTKSDERTM